jgi:hypothetical protein
LKLRNHLELLGWAMTAWLVFWIAGLPDYYQQYPTKTIGIACTLLSVVISLVALATLGRRSPQRRVTRASWMALYFTLPFAALDYLYCGVYLGKGIGFLSSYWYLSIFYVTPWLTFPPTAWLLNRSSARNTVSRANLPCTGLPKASSEGSHQRRVSESSDDE